MLLEGVSVLCGHCAHTGHGLGLNLGHWSPSAHPPAGTNSLLLDDSFLHPLRAPQNAVPWRLLECHKSRRFCTLPPPCKVPPLAKSPPPRDTVTSIFF